MYEKIRFSIVDLPNTLNTLLKWILSMIKVVTSFFSKMISFLIPSFTVKELATLLMMLGLISKIFVLVIKTVQIDHVFIDYVTIFANQYLVIMTTIVIFFETFYVDLRNFLTNYKILVLENKLLKEDIELVRKTYHLDLKNMKKELTEARGDLEGVKNLNASLSAENLQFVKELKELKSETEWDKYVKILAILSSSLTVGSNLVGFSFNILDLVNGNSQARDIKDLGQNIEFIRKLIVGLQRQNNHDLGSDRMSGGSSPVFRESQTDLENIGDIS